MNIFALSSGIAQTFEALGHTVLSFPSHHGATVFELDVALRERGFVPDLIFQEESLLDRVVLKGLDTFDCPKIFWSVDSHLNLFWHLNYARLFDGVMTPHVSIWKRVRAETPPLERLARYGVALPWRPHAERRHSVGFVGRITQHRPLRQWLAEFLQTTFQAHVASDLNFQDMLRTYQDVRLAPNESIMTEVNFRLLETASCGCLAFCQEVGTDQDALFLPGQEIMTFCDVLELKALLDHFLAHPDLAERKARAAWERVQAEHLPIHRARRVLEFARTLTSRGAKGFDAVTAFWLSIWQLRRSKRVAFPLETIDDALSKLPATAEILAARVGVLVWLGRAENTKDLAALIFEKEYFAADMELNLACSMAGVLLGDWPLAKQFWYRQQRASRREPPARPERPFDLCLLWARELMRESVLQTPGSTFDPERHLPCSALECVYLAQTFEPHDQEAIRLVDAIFARSKGSEYFRLGALSEISLVERSNWRAGLALGVVNLHAFRLQQGLEEIVLALNAARSQGKERPFLRTLSGLDRKGYVRAVLATLAANTTPRTH